MNMSEINTYRHVTAQQIHQKCKYKYTIALTEFTEGMTYTTINVPSVKEIMNFDHFK